MIKEYQHKVVCLDELLRAAAEHRAAGQTLVHCHGCFDVVHPGHVRYLEFARAQGDVLIVSLTGDLAVNKGPNRPYIPQELRAENLAALLFVDYVYINPELTAERLLDALRPNLYVKGHEYESSTDPGFLSEKAVVENYGGRMLYSSGEIVFSSTELIGGRRPLYTGSAGRMNTETPADDARLVGAATEADGTWPPGMQKPIGYRTRGQDAATGKAGLKRALPAQRLPRLCEQHSIDAPSFDRLFDGFNDLNVLVVGDTIIDRYVLCDALGVAGEGPMMSLVQRDERRYVGGAAVVARHVAALGGRPFLLSAGVPPLNSAHPGNGNSYDTEMSLVRDVLTSEGVRFEFLECRPALVEKTRYLADDTKLFKVDRAHRLPLDSVAERHAARLLEQQSKGIDAVILCDFGYGMITDSLLNRVLPALRQNARIITADVSGGRANLLNFRNVDLLCPTELEARAMLNDYDSGIATIAWEILRQSQARHLIVTLGKRGLLAFERKSQQRESPDWSARLKSEQLPAFAEYAIDQMGCGDALLAAATMALASNANLMQAAYLGNIAAALEAGQLGNQPVSATQHRAWLAGGQRPLQTTRTVASRIVTVPGGRNPTKPGVPIEHGPVNPNHVETESAT